MIEDILKYAVANLWHRKRRSFLSILSILIGITAVFALISFGQGIQKYINDISKEQGMDKILVMPKDFMAAPGSSNILFSKSDLDFIKKVNGVDEAAGILTKTAKIKFKDYKEKYVFAISVPTDSGKLKLFEELMYIDIKEGRPIKKGDLANVVLGHNYLIPDKLFKKEIGIGNVVEINDISLKVVGFYKEIGNPQDDSQIYISEEEANIIFERETYDYMMIRSSPDQAPGKVADRIKEKFRKYRDQNEGQEDFFVQTFEDTIKTFTSIVDIINGILVLIALISVVVAAVNIMNTMYTSILERTREIGIMKSIGAKNNIILLAFIAESGILGLSGGIIGMSLGYIIAKTGEFVASYYGLSMLRPAFPLWLIIGCILFSFLVGAGSGFIPARQASKLNPVDALRYE